MMPPPVQLCLSVWIFALVAQVALGQWSEVGHPWAHLESRWEDVEKCPSECVCMDNQAHCDAMMLKHMPRPLSSELEALHLRNNLLRKLHHGHFNHLRYLKHLNLKGNRLTHIAADTFKEQRYLQSLSLTENNVKSLSPDTFKNLGRLRFFSLRKNKLNNVEGLFSRLFSLQLLNLARNRIKKISHRTFRNNWHLMVLDLHGNRISYVHKHAFRTLHHIKYLVLRDNPLKNIDLNFKPNIHLELLDFTGCQLKEVVKGLPASINDLRLSENNISAIRKQDFKSTKKIRLLVLTNNKIDTIDDDAFSPMFQLYDLYLGKNLITKLPHKLPKSVHGIFMYSNNISRIDKSALIHIHGLEFLNFRDNNIEELEQDTFWSLGNLKSLDLSKNMIGSIKSYTFQGNKNLQKLDLSRNPLLKLDHDSFSGLENLHIFEMSSVGSELDHPQIHPVIFRHMKKLLYLDLSNSSQVVREMKEHPYSLDYINSVEDLNLMEDNLRGLPAKFPNYFPHLHMIKLIGNPWHCDYDILWLAYWMRNYTVEFFAPELMVCASPPHLEGVPIPHLTPGDVLPVTKKKPVIDYVEITLKELSKSGSNYTIYYTKDPNVTPSPEYRTTLKEPTYRTTLKRRFNLPPPAAKGKLRKRKKKHKNKASWKNDTVKKSRRRNHVLPNSEYDITPPKYTSLRERYIDPVTTYKTLPPNVYDTSRNHITKARIMKQALKNLEKKRRKQSGTQSLNQHTDKSSSEETASGYSSSSGERGVLLNIHP